MDPAGPGAIRTVYRRHAARYDARRLRSLFERGWLARFRSEMAPEAAVLSLGCGAGEPIEWYLVAAGHALTGVDFSPEMLAIARARLPQADWVEADMRGLALGRQFGGVVAWDSFFHLTREDQREMFSVFARHVLPGGALMFTSGPADVEAVGSVEGDPVFHASLAPSEYAALLAGAGFDLRAFIAEDRDCDGHSVWLARKSAETLARTKISG